MISILFFSTMITVSMTTSTESPIQVLQKEFLVNNFTGPMTKETLAALSHIEVLNLKNSNITNYPSHVFSLLPNLKKIVVLNSQFNIMDPNIYEGANKLEDILFVHNDVPELPLDLLRHTTFEKIIIADQPQVKEIPRNFANETQRLKYFECSKCAIGSIENEAFTNLNQLEVLDLRKNSIRNLPKNVFEPLKNLRTLNLHGNSLEKFTSDDLKGMHNLKSIDLSDNPLRELNLLDYEKFAPKLKSLNIVGTQIPETQIDEHVRKLSVSIVADRLD